ncbi:O-sialoglycoprotein endopeptidase [Bacillus horti]|uniref:N(6)-L-threonylcarbamoyladenine synthase n=1 Tax=Caldalkalibacillus horti TaxID=77523 RepID=A0ABT9W201_9BACI|nr:O-sialoglycoprotein endopeptidase [Bacillus horti]MDQ0166875.1 N6-L-threonylcarbamoyladenine synthase [Bacillus horti]
MAFLGIDTSNYRTSFCVIDEHFQIVHEQNPLLPVAEGELGLQQSKAVFEHLRQWSEMLKAMPRVQQIKAIGVSIKPRPMDHSYMPVFRVGEVLAQTLAHFLSVPLYSTSHQEGHIAAGEFTASESLDDQFIAVHLSGGTSEVLLCTRKEAGYSIEKLGGTLDLHAGQFVDRVGVALNLPFPSGPSLERLAQTSEDDPELNGVLKQSKNSFTISSFCKGVDFSFSGPTTAALRLVQQSSAADYPHIARAVERNIAKTIEKSLLTAMKQTGIKDILLVGGVASNVYITTILKKRLEHRAVKGRLILANPVYATDNAFGVACIAGTHFNISR